MIRDFLSPFAMLLLVIDLFFGGMLMGAALVAGASQAAEGPKGPPSPEALFERLDGNADGTISAAEFDAQGAARFDRMDSDASGTVSFEEFTAKHRQRGTDRAEARFSRLDRDGNGTLDRGEMQAGGQAHFARLDQNGDGSLTLEEIKSLRRPAAGRD